MRKRLLCTALLLQVAFTSSALGTESENLLENGRAISVEESAQERINFSGKLRMLSQRIPSAVCHLNNGINVEGAHALLVSATAEFDQILRALEFGDVELNIINPETRRKTLARIHELQEKWKPFNEAAQAVINGSATDAEFDLIVAKNIEILGSAQRVVEALVKQYSNPNAVTSASLMLIDISGRQRMLTQKMSKESCMVGSGSNEPQMHEDLENTMRIFEASLDALRHGMPQVGVLPPPNDEIYMGLEGVRGDWEAVRPYLSATLDGSGLDDASHVDKFQGLNETMANMNAVVSLYAEAAGTSN